ncbi:MAG TPA: chorismate-binding protein [Gammaproteobacteria bacterium]|nr:chorismate-binding protein [Gammaproteobacteria bacterium]
MVAGRSGDLLCRGLRRVALARLPQPSQALEALLPLGAALLESRTDHPGARYSVVAFSPLAELRLDRGRLTLRLPGGGEEEIAGPPLPALFARLEAVRTMSVAADVPFAGGWIGYFAHELGCLMMEASPAAAMPPARPTGPLAVFRLYRDALVVDHRAQTAALYASDWGEGEEDVQRRLAAAQGLLHREPKTSIAPEVVDPPALTLAPREFAERQEKLQVLIRAGDCFQANLTASWAWPWRNGAPTVAELVALYRRYTEANPGAWCGLFPDDEATILCGSPELLVDWRHQRVAMRPIAGTRPRGADSARDAAFAAELRGDAKERAEHAMLVDLARNDLARISRPGSVRVENFAGVERYRHVMHLVSEVTGEARDGLDLESLLRAVFPGGTVTGAPKRRALSRIGELERGPRGAYTGALGYVALGGASQWNLMIRTLTATPTHLVAHAGCGIVAGSQSELEAAELAAKARAQAEAALGRATPATPADRCGEVEPGSRWESARGVPIARPARVLIVDFEDSFVHNLGDYCRRLGAETAVVSAHASPGPAWESTVTHLILSPGPGRPEDFPLWRHHLEFAEARGIPVLGVCLGHQALAEAAGAKLVCHSETVHGSASRLLRLPASRTDPLFGAWSGETVGRYHSLVVIESVPAMEALATLEDGTLMAVRYRARPHWGLQFHPESLLTENGLDLISAFLHVESP